jgi:cupin 2 domain-containing protein
MDINNFLKNIPVAANEQFETILDTRNCKIERIVSRGHSSPEGFWYDQEKDEWVMVMKGSAGLLFAGQDEVFVLNPGDYIYIPKHRKHRVVWTAPDQETIWLTVHC